MRDSRRVFAIRLPSHCLSAVYVLQRLTDRPQTGIPATNEWLLSYARPHARPVPPDATNRAPLRTLPRPHSPAAHRSCPLAEAGRTLWLRRGARTRCRLRRWTKTPSRLTRGGRGVMRTRIIVIPAPLRPEKEAARRTHLRVRAPCARRNVVPVVYQEQGGCGNDVNSLFSQSGRAVWPYVSSTMFHTC